MLTDFSIRAKPVVFSASNEGTRLKAIETDQKPSETTRYASSPTEKREKKVSDILPQWH